VLHAAVTPAGVGTVPRVPDDDARDVSGRDGHAGTDVAVHDGLFVLGDEPVLIGGRCRECGRVCFPRHEICPYCSLGPVDEIELSRHGTLWAWTAVTAAPPGYEGPVPYGFGVVDLDEGLRVITRITESDPSNLEKGQQMELVLDVLTEHDGHRVLTYAFAPSAR
jgi:uncharacterized OB-fold protein